MITIRIRELICRLKTGHYFAIYDEMALKQCLVCLRVEDQPEVALTDVVVRE